MVLGQMRQNRFIDAIIAERCLKAFETLVTQPIPEVHDGVPTVAPDTVKPAFSTARWLLLCKIGNWTKKFGVRTAPTRQPRRAANLPLSVH
jgi:hypothetical protein